MDIVTISGSLRAGSYNTRLLQLLPTYAPDGMQFRHFDGLRDLPLYDEDADDIANPHPAVAALRETLRSADGLVIASPEYNHSISGVLKNAIDWASRPITHSAIGGATVAVVTATTGALGGFRGLAETSRILHDLGAFVVAAPEVNIQLAQTKFVADDDAPGGFRLNDPLAETLLRVVLRGLAGAIDGGAGDLAAAPMRDLLASFRRPKTGAD